MNQKEKASMSSVWNSPAKWISNLLCFSKSKETSN